MYGLPTPVWDIFWILVSIGAFVGGIRALMNMGFWRGASSGLRPRRFDYSKVPPGLRMHYGIVFCVMGIVALSGILWRPLIVGCVLLVIYSQILVIRMRRVS
jgi:hypothetical protein